MCVQQDVWCSMLYVTLLYNRSVYTFFRYTDINIYYLLQYFYIRGSGIFLGGNTKAQIFLKVPKKFGSF